MGAVCLHAFATVKAKIYTADRLIINQVTADLNRCAFVMSEPAMMDKMESALAAALEDHLISLGFFVTRQFVVPNTHGRLIDLYIAAPLRAFVEIKLREPKAAIRING